MEPRTLTTSIIVDPMGHGFGEFTPEDEVKEYVESFSKLLAPHTLKWKQQWCVDPPIGTDLVIYDFGGMMPGATELVDGNTRDIIHWAEDHPSGLVCIASTFTYLNYIEIEMKELGLTLPNIICWDQSQAADDNIREWFGLGKYVDPPEVAKLRIPCRRGR